MDLNNLEEFIKYVTEFPDVDATGGKSGDHYVVRAIRGGSLTTSTFDGHGRFLRACASPLKDSEADFSFVQDANGVLSALGLPTPADESEEK